MKKHLIKIISLCFAVALTLSSAFVTVFAADGGELTINSEAKVKKGDKVKYTLYLSDTKEDIIGFELRLFYDHNYLELDRNAINYPKFDSVVHNLDLEDKIPVNWTNINAPASFSSKAEFLSMEFTVLQGGETEISQFVTEMYGNDMTYLKSYTWSYDITVNDKVVAENMTPVISRDEETLQKRQGGIINYIDGMGEENSPNKDNHEAVVVTEIENVTRYEKVNSNEGFNVMPLAVAGGAIAIIGAIIAIVIIKKREDAKISAQININQED